MLPVGGGRLFADCPLNLRAKPPRTQSWWMILSHWLLWTLLVHFLSNTTLALPLLISGIRSSHCVNVFVSMRLLLVYTGPDWEIFSALRLKQCWNHLEKTGYSWNKASKQKDLLHLRIVGQTRGEQLGKSSESIIVSISDSQELHGNTAFERWTWIYFSNPIASHQGESGHFPTLVLNLIWNSPLQNAFTTCLRWREQSSCQLTGMFSARLS